ncbi:hypothetical protein B0H14DRAFT_2575568 [Mycena olivaceomarginata]|nr:hypothetical protein B0H14DRAFT_2575568 [Mycena olivaceomarginata]
MKVQVPPEIMQLKFKLITPNGGSGCSSENYNENELTWEGQKSNPVDNTTQLQAGQKREEHSLLHPTSAGDRIQISVQISSKTKYNAGSLFIADFASMPAACGVWPAWFEFRYHMNHAFLSQNTSSKWTVGPSRLHGGEVDVLEGIHVVNTNKMTLHTSENCIIAHRERMTGKANLTNCTSSNGDNQRLRSPGRRYDLVRAGVQRGWGRCSWVKSG